MNDADRIRALRDEGRIDDRQAERLLAAIDAIAADEADSPTPPHATAPAEASDAPPAPSAPPAPPQPAATARTEAHATAQAPAAPQTAPQTNQAPSMPTPPADAPDTGEDTDAPTAVDTIEDVDRWIRIDLFACELDVVVDETVTEPVAQARKGDVELERTDDGWRLVQSGRPEGTWLERLVDGVQQARIDLRLPPRTGVRLDVKAGDVELSGVPALSGRLRAGDLDARGLRAVDLRVNAGDVDLELDPVPGRHRVHLTVGDLTLNLAEGADARVHGDVSIGDASAVPPLTAERRGMVAQVVDGVLGEGRAFIALDVGTGDLDVRRSHHGS